MKLLVAYIRPESLNDVKKALYEKEIYMFSVTNALGCGQQKGYSENYRGVQTEVNLLKKVRLEIALNDGFVEPATQAIVKGAKTGQIGDGKIFVTSLERVVRIRTGEADSDAL